VTSRGLAVSDSERDTIAFARLAERAKSLPDTEQHSMFKACATLDSTHHDLVGHALVGQLLPDPDRRAQGCGSDDMHQRPRVL
jgi:hypothetical protein